MSDTGHDYEFIGGSMDGQVFHVEGELWPGMQWPTVAGPNGRREIYVYGADGKFHFDSYSLSINPNLYTPEALAERRAIYERLSAVLTELDVIIDRHGGPDGGSLNIGNWTIKHKNA